MPPILRRFLGSLPLPFRHDCREQVPTSGDTAGAGDIALEVQNRHQDFVNDQCLPATDDHRTTEASRPSGPQHTASAPATLTSAPDTSHQDARSSLPAHLPPETSGNPSTNPIDTSNHNLDEGGVSQNPDIKTTYFSTQIRRRRALLVACTYEEFGAGDYGYLKHSYKDVFKIYRLLMSAGWEAEEITILCDSEGIWPQPTRENIVSHLRELAAWAKAGDLILFLFSGHGDQMEAKCDQHETDGKDEYILPCDFYELKERGEELWYILDDELRSILVDTLTLGARLIAIFDACSSGTILDLPVEDLGGHPDSHEVGPSLSSLGPILPNGGVSTRPSPAETRPSSSTVVPRVHVEDDNNHPNPRRARLMTRLSIPRANLAGWMRGRARRRTASPQIRPAPVPLVSQQQDSPTPNESPPVDGRVIHGHAICISACHDNASTFQTGEGGLLVSHFCDIMHDALATPERAVSIREIQAGLNNRILQAFNLAKERSKGWNNEWKVPVPLLCFSHKMDYGHTLLNLN